MRRYALRDDQWERIEDILPGHKDFVGMTARDKSICFTIGCLSRLFCIGIEQVFLGETFLKGLEILE